MTLKISSLSDGRMKTEGDTFLMRSEKPLRVMLHVGGGTASS